MTQAVAEERTLPAKINALASRYRLNRERPLGGKRTSLGREPLGVCGTTCWRSSRTACWRVARAPRFLGVGEEPATIGSSPSCSQRLLVDHQGSSLYPRDELA